jgi:XTP/dITP diphosphohydrolase
MAGCLNRFIRMAIICLIMKHTSEIYFVTKNRHKFEEVKAVLGSSGIKVIQVPEEKDEPKDMSLVDVASTNAKKFYDILKKPVAVEDTGVYFNAYPDFPGNSPKLMFSSLGYKGLLRLLEGEDRHAEFRAAVGFCDERGVKVFEGILRGEISDHVHDPERDVMPYERIFLIGGKPISAMSREEKNGISHRAAAFRKLAAYLKSFTNS